MNDNCNPDIDDSYLMYYDINNLYGAAMIHHLPIGNFEWVGELSQHEINLMNLSEKSNTGYIYEVDLEYSINLHELHKDILFCPEHFKIPM